MEIPADYAHVCLYLKNAASSREACVGFGVWTAGVGASSTANKVETAVKTAGGFEKLIGTTTSCNMVEVRVGVEAGDPVPFLKPISLAGSGGSLKVASNVAVLIHKRTSLGGRPGRGRMFMPWSAADTDVDEAGYIQSSAVTTLQAAANIFFVALNTNGVPMRLLHSRRKDGSIPPPTEVDSLLVDNLVSTQRRRLGR